MSEENPAPPPPPEEEEDPPPPPSDDDDNDNEDENDNPDDNIGFSVMVEPPPPPERFAMTEEEAKSTGLVNLKKKLMEVAMQELLLVGPEAPTPVMQMIAIASKPVAAKAVFALTICFHDWDTAGQEDADLLDLDWTDFDTPQVQALLKEVGLEQKDAYPMEDIKALIHKKVDNYIAKTPAVDLVPSMLDYVTNKITESLSLSNNMSFRMSIDLGHTVPEEAKS